SGPSSAASRSSALAGNGLQRLEHLLEPPDLLRGADADQDVADVDRRVRLGRRVEGAVGLAEADDDRARLVADAQVADRPSRCRARAAHLDLLEPELGSRG